MAQAILTLYHSQHHHAITELHHVKRLWYLSFHLECQLKR